MQALRVGIGGPVGSGKTALTLSLCRAMREHYDMAVVTNDIYTREDAQFLTRHGALEQDRISGVETGGQRWPPSQTMESEETRLDIPLSLHQRASGTAPAINDRLSLPRVGISQEMRSL